MSSEGYPTAGSYFHSSQRWRKRTGGSLIGYVALGAVAAGMTGSQLAVVVFIAVAVVVTLARRGQP